MAVQYKMSENLEWNGEEIKTFLNVVNTNDGSSLQKKFCTIMARIAHKRMLDVWIFYQFYQKFCKLGSPMNEIGTTWNGFRSNPSNMKKLSHKLNDIKNIDMKSNNIHVVCLKPKTDDVYNEIIDAACNNTNIIKGLEIQRINTLLATNTDLTDIQINQLQILKKNYESN